ncbi:SRPBCC family protein [Sphingoaurantiacus capsulatus]|uniref:SRPBCC family protein n=1 Tax=Sphingoaurantiacus capsulatus TaxID=1771310 RepID=A0ABV7X844_9SPHN
MKRTAILLLLAASAPASARVVSTQPHGFEISETAVVKAAPEVVYRTLVDIASWWDGNHSYSGNAANISIDARAGGCWCEKLSDGGSIEHMRIVYAQPGKVLRAQGGLGPLQGEGATGSLTYTIKPAAGGGSEVTQTYVVGGYLRPGAEKLAPGVDAVMSAGFKRLVAKVDGVAR